MAIRPLTSTALHESAAKAAVEFSWQAHPARERPRRAIAGACCIGAFSALLGAAFGSLLVAGVSLVVLPVALNRFFLSTRFEIDAQGITARYPLRTQRTSWASVRRFLHDEYGGYLSTRAVRSWLDPFSGMHLLFGSNPAQVIDQVQRRLAARPGL